MNESEDSVTQWIHSLQEGSHDAAQKVWDRYFEALTRYARNRLGVRRREADEEDAVITAMQSFFARIQDGKFSALHDREDLWKLLVVITARKVSAQKRRAMAQKRGGRVLRGESVFVGGKASDLAALVADLPADQLLFEIKEYFKVLVESLDPALRKIAEFRLSGLSSVAIAEELQCSKRSVERKLERIRARWDSKFD
ncbi:MAG: ECF-type sigma factor [Planctomycetota bacterium]